MVLLYLMQRNSNILFSFIEIYCLLESFTVTNEQLLDEVEQNIVICQRRADQLFTEAVGRGK